MSERLQICQCNKPRSDSPVLNQSRRLDKNYKPLAPRPPLIQAKLTISRPGDEYEQEADRVAEQIMRMPDPVLQRKCIKCSEDEEKVLQTKELPGQASVTQSQNVPSIVHEVLHSPGKPLDMETRAFMEPRLGHDFSKVRVYTDSKAVESARAVNAHSFTVGNQIVFNYGEYAPHTRSGQKLIAHELTHVVQQTGDSASDCTAQRGFIAQHLTAPRLQGSWRLDSVQPSESLEVNFKRGNGSVLSFPMGINPGFTGGVFGQAKTWQETGFIHQQVGGQAQVARWVTKHYIFKNDGAGHDFLQLRMDAQLAGNAKAEDLRYARAGAAVWGRVIKRTAANPTPRGTELFTIKDGGISAATVGDLGVIEVEIPLGEGGGSATITIPLKKVNEGDFAPFSGSHNMLYDVPSTVDEVDVLLGARIEADADIETAFTGLAPWISRNFNTSRANGLFSLAMISRPEPRGRKTGKEKEGSEAEISATAGSRGYKCVTKCHQQCPSGVEGTVSGESNKNCAEATKKAKSAVRKGCYPRHCNCKDTEGFIGKGTQCENHTR